MKNLLLLFIMISFVCTSCTTKTSSQEKRNISIKSVTATYKNPVYSENSPDPSVVRETWYVLRIFWFYGFRITDLVNWERVIVGHLILLPSGRKVIFGLLM